jgi:hypothetical protein
MMYDPFDSGTHQLWLSRLPLLTDESAAEEAEEPLRDKAPARAPKTTTVTKDAIAMLKQNFSRRGPGRIKTPGIRATIS